MRKSYGAGLVLAVTAGLIVLISSALDLDLASVALLGAAMGAVVALVPDRTPAARLAGFAAGFVLGWIGYVVRAAVLPDTSLGQALDVAVVVVLAVAIAAASGSRLPLWTLLLGLGAFAGAYELTFVDDPTQVLTTSLSTATTMLFNVGAGFLVASLVGPAAAGRTASHRDGTPGEPETTDEMAIGGAR